MDYLNILTNRKLISHDKLVLMYLMHPSYRNRPYREHAEILNISPRTVGESITRLVKSGYVVKFERGYDGKGCWHPNFLRIRVTDAGWALVGRHREEGIKCCQ